MAELSADELLASIPDEALAGLRELLMPMCCHITGMHDPTHFREQKYVCEFQKRYAWERTWKVLFGEEPTPAEIPSDPECGWCRDA